MKGVVLVKWIDRAKLLNQGMIVRVSSGDKSRIPTSSYVMWEMLITQEREKDVKG